jgi:hypothetical protein
MDIAKQPDIHINDRMFDEFRDIRVRLWSEATEGITENQRKLRNEVEGLSNDANLDVWRTNSAEVCDRFWKQFIAKIFYSGFKAATVNRALPDIYRMFGDYKSLRSPEWDVRLVGQKFSTDSGLLALRYLQDKDSSQRKIRHPQKIKKVVAVARSFAEYFDENPDADALSFLMHGVDSDNVWLLSKNLERLGLSGQLIQLHLMMDLGFNCIKPDVVISRLVLQLGWLSRSSMGFPADINEADLIGKGKYGNRFHYTKDIVIKPIVDLARAFAIKMSQEKKKLEDDIGWVSNNLIREFDIFMVLYGQRPDSSWGIMKQLAKASFQASEKKRSCRSTAQRS